jgi:hypothetical protein
MFLEVHKKTRVQNRRGPEVALRPGRSYRRQNSADTLISVYAAAEISVNFRPRRRDSNEFGARSANKGKHA